MGFLWMTLQTSGSFIYRAWIPCSGIVRKYNSFSFAEDSIEFQCRYARSINTSSQITLIPDGEPVLGYGDLNYTMTVTGSNTDGSLALGGNTDVRITPNHGFDQVAPRLANELSLLCSSNFHFISESYHVIFLMKNMIYMQCIRSPAMNYASIIAGTVSLKIEL